MNLRTDFHVMLWIESRDDHSGVRDDLLGLLADHPVVAIHEADSDGGFRWGVAFDETAWYSPEHVDANSWLTAFEQVWAPLDAHWRRYPDLAELAAVTAGKDIVSRFGPCVRCELEANPDLVIVNLEAAQIHAWADAIIRHVRPGGHLLLSGFLDAERDVVMRRFTPSELVVKREDGWAAALLTRPAD